jgi:hypothetical protein
MTVLSFLSYASDYHFDGFVSSSRLVHFRDLGVQLRRAGTRSRRRRKVLSDITCIPIYSLFQILG